MDSTLKAKWVEALRSDEFKQGRGYLCRIDNDNRSFCCLGVALEIQGAQWAENPTGAVSFFTPKVFFNGETYEGNSLEPDIQPAFPELAIETIERLMDMNDIGRTFPEIADYIEKNL